jgi:ribosomal protein L6P/L9E
MSTKQVEKFETLVEIPEGVTASINKYMLQVQGPSKISKKSRSQFKLKITKSSLTHRELEKRILQY